MVKKGEDLAPGSPACLFAAQGRVYRPNVVRVGSEEAPLSARARDVWVDGLTRRYMDMEQPGERSPFGSTSFGKWNGMNAAELAQL